MCVGEEGRNRVFRERGLSLLTGVFRDLHFSPSLNREARDEWPRDY